MKTSKKSLVLFRKSLLANKKKNGICFWRFFFTAYEKDTNTQRKFFIELEFLNSFLSPDTVLLGFKPISTISEDDLQYALAGTFSDKNLTQKQVVVPSYVSTKIFMLGKGGKQLCAYFPLKSVKITPKVFEIQIGNKYFSEDKLTGFINITEDDLKKCPELLCNSGFSNWDLHYQVKTDCEYGFKDKKSLWLPYGLKTSFLGNLSFNGKDYIVDEEKSNGYLDYFLSKNLDEPWFHISSCKLTSLISGKTLTEASFALQGIFNKKLSFMANFDDSEIQFSASTSSKKYSVIWNCTQVPVTEDENEMLHWSVSINSKIWIIDIDVYCNTNELLNRTIELSEGNGKTLNVVSSGSGNGEIKLFKRIKNDLEQIEFAKINDVICEFGNKDQYEI